ncbi:MAG: hypothetical protein IH840_09100 [Candidatus Heimdallarchaeota archaeon]|nr:hypothetical protein [Candidatus Heimdallarchaeota archaeon]
MDCLGYHPNSPYLHIKVIEKFVEENDNEKNESGSYQRITNRSIRRLIKKNIIEKAPDRGNYRFTTSGFFLWKTKRSLEVEARQIKESLDDLSDQTEYSPEIDVSDLINGKVTVAFSIQSPLLRKVAERYSTEKERKEAIKGYFVVSGLMLVWHDYDPSIRQLFGSFKDKMLDYYNVSSVMDLQDPEIVDKYLLRSVFDMGFETLRKGKIFD